jgi:hypothetical protein
VLHDGTDAGRWKNEKSTRRHRLAPRKQAAEVATRERNNWM